MLNNSFRSSESLVSIHNQQPITTSLLVADKFGKRHANVVRSIQRLPLANSKLSSLYQSTTYKDEQGKNRPMYLMNKDGFVLLVMGFTGPQALAFKIDYINAFNAMEEKLRRMREQPDLAHYVPIQRYNQLQQMYDFQVEQVRWWTDMYSKQTKIVANLVDRMMGRKAKQLQTPTWMTIVGYATLHNLSCGLNVAARLGRKAAELCARQGIVPDTIPDPRFGRVNTYPLHVLEEVFNAI